MMIYFILGLVLNALSLVFALSVGALFREIERAEGDVATLRIAYRVSIICALSSVVCFFMWGVS